MGGGTISWLVPAQRKSEFLFASAEYSARDIRPLEPLAFGLIHSSSFSASLVGLRVTSSYFLELQPIVIGIIGG